MRTTIGAGLAIAAILTSLHTSVAQTVPPGDAGTTGASTLASPNGASYSVIASLNLQGTVRRRRVLKGHIEGSVSVNRVDAVFSIKPTVGCSLSTDLAELKLSPFGTHNSRWLGIASATPQELRANYWSEGCHGFLGISCGFGYMNLDYEVVQYCEESISPERQVRTVPAATSVRIAHSACDSTPCPGVAGYWTVVARGANGQSCSADVDGAVSGGLTCVVTDNHDGSLTVEIH